MEYDLIVIGAGPGGYEAAFEAADRLGMLMQPELSHWNPKDALENDAAWDYYRRELLQILRVYANHPSFVMLTLGNELAADPLGHRRMDALLELARGTDDTRLYANGSNVHYGERGCDPASDFYTSSGYYSDALRATLAVMPQETTQISASSMSVSSQAASFFSISAYRSKRWKLSFSSSAGER